MSKNSVVTIGVFDGVHIGQTAVIKNVVDSARRALTKGEPRVTLEEVTMEPDPQRLSHANLSIRYRLRYDGSPGSLDLALQFGA